MKNAFYKTPETRGDVYKYFVLSEIQTCSLYVIIKERKSTKIISEDKLELTYSLLQLIFTDLVLTLWTVWCYSTWTADNLVTCQDFLGEFQIVLSQNVT